MEGKFMNEYLLIFDRLDRTYRVRVQFLGERRRNLIAERTCDLEQLVELMRMLEHSDGLMTFDGYPGKVTKLELDPARREAVLRVTLVNT